MHRVFQAFIDRLSDSVDLTALRSTMADAAAAYDLSCFAYLALPRRRGDQTLLISTYPTGWTAHYLEQRYERLDPVILLAQRGTNPFEWGLGAKALRLSKRQRQLFDEAAEFGIRCGFTIPIHDRRGPVAAMTFAADGRHPAFRRGIELHGEVLQLLGMYFHAHARRALAVERTVDGVPLSPREYECLTWSAQGKSAWAIARILGISPRTVAFHLDNAKEKLGVQTVKQAIARYSASKRALS